MTPLSTLLNRAIEAAHPYSASLELTYQCNLACSFCYNPIQRKNQGRKDPPPPPAGPPLTYDEIIHLLDQLKEMGILYLTLTGGEAFLHPRFWDIAREAKNREFAIRIFTNGYAITESVARRLRDLSPFCIEMSLHGATAETAEKLNQVKGSHARQMAALENLHREGLRVYLKVVVTKIVEDQLFELKAIGDRFGYPVYFDPILTLSDDGQKYPLDLMASDQALENLYRQEGLNIGNSPFEREPGEYNCTVGTGMMHITPYGDVQPCTQWKQTVGNIRKTPLREIWENSELLQEVRRINRAVPGKIRESGEDHAFCASCPGLSKLSSGDPLKIDDQYLRVARIRRRVSEAEATGAIGQRQGNLVSIRSQFTNQP